MASNGWVVDGKRVKTGSSPTRSLVYVLMVSAVRSLSGNHDEEGGHDEEGVLTRIMAGWRGVAKLACILLHTPTFPRHFKVARSPTNQEGVAFTQRYLAEVH